MFWVGVAIVLFGVLLLVGVLFVVAVLLGLSVVKPLVMAGLALNAAKPRQAVLNKLSGLLTSPPKSALPATPATTQQPRKRPVIAAANDDLRDPE